MNAVKFTKHRFSTGVLIVLLFIFWIIALSVFFSLIGLINKAVGFIFPLAIIMGVLHSFYCVRNVASTHSFHEDRVSVQFPYKPSKNTVIPYSKIEKITWQVSAMRMGGEKAMEYNMIIHSLETNFQVHRPWPIWIGGSEANMPRGIPTEEVVVIDAFDVIGFFRSFNDKLNLTHEGLHEYTLKELKKTNL